MWRFVFWAYFLNAVLLTCHEIDSAYWREWNLFASLFQPADAPKDNIGGLTGFLLFHIPALCLLQYGLLEVYKRSLAGLVMSIVLGVCGVMAFLIHMYFMSVGRTEFQVPISVFILIATLIVSLGQLGGAAMAYSKRLHTPSE